jgi:deferrochelatase/peroxidase EfeB
VLIGDQMSGTRNKALTAVHQLLEAAHGVTILGKEKGHGLHNSNGDGIEHFGYVDGRSQPLFLTEEIDDERLTTDGTGNWDPAFALSRVIVPDPAAPDPTKHFGSYFVFRKLEQDVKKFKSDEKALAKRLHLKGDDAERAGAMLVGRFEDGTPLTSQFSDGSHHPVPNDFDYDSDPDGAKCPFFGHIRKVNPRGSGGFEPVEQERLHIMARRGQTYGVRTDQPNDGRIDNKPSKDVGLLFMAFNADIAQQFEFAQSTWANNPGFPRVPPGAGAPGLDLVIGQSPNPRPDIHCPVAWGGSTMIHHHGDAAGGDDERRRILLHAVPGVPAELVARHRPPRNGLWNGRLTWRAEDCRTRPHPHHPRSAPVAGIQPTRVCAVKGVYRGHGRDRAGFPPQGRE